MTMPPIATQNGQLVGNEIAFQAFKTYGYQNPTGKPTTAPVISVDRTSLDELELRVCEIALYQMAAVINMATKKGAIYGQVILPPDEAQMKLEATQGGQ